MSSTSDPASLIDAYFERGWTDGLPLLGTLGENRFDGTPLNPTAPDRIPGGSSSGSASAVAQGLCDPALARALEAARRWT